MKPTTTKLGGRRYGKTSEDLMFQARVMAATIAEVRKTKKRVVILVAHPDGPVEVVIRIPRKRRK